MKNFPSMGKDYDLWLLLGQAREIMLRVKVKEEGKCKGEPSSLYSGTNVHDALEAYATRQRLVNLNEE